MKHKKKKPIVFAQSYGTYEHDILVAAGATQKDVIAFCKKYKAEKDMVKWMEEDVKLFEFAKTKAGLYSWNELPGSVFKVLLLKPFEDTWKYWEVLAHELHHAVHHLSKLNQMEDEIESQAYLFEFLFREIRRKLQGVDKI